MEQLPPVPLFGSHLDFLLIRHSKINKRALQLFRLRFVKLSMLRKSSTLIMALLKPSPDSSN